MSCVDIQYVRSLCERCRRRGLRQLLCIAACLNVEGMLIFNTEVQVTRDKVSELAKIEVDEETYRAVAGELDGKVVRGYALAAYAAAALCKELVRVLGGRKLPEA